MPFPTYTRTMLAEGWDIDVPRLAKEIGAAIPKPLKVVADGTTVTIDDGGGFTPGEQTTCDTVVADHIAAFDPLPEYKLEKQRAIDARTAELIFQGFTYGGKTLSLSISAQSYWTNLYQARNIMAAGGLFPLTVNTLDDLDTYSVASVADAEGLYQTAVGTMTSRLASGTALKNQVRAATTKAEVDAVVDSR